MSIYISLTTIKSRLNNTLKKTLDSLLNQTIKCKINVYVSKDKYMCDEGIKEYELEPFKQFYKDKVSFIYTRNSGSYRKLLPILSEVDNAIIITVDDDFVHEKNFVENMINAYNIHQCIICGSARIFNFQSMIGYESNKNKITDFKYASENVKSMNLIPEGFCGVLYHTSFFDDKVYLFDNVKNKDIYSNDDLWFRCNTYSNSIPVFTCGTERKFSTCDISLFKNYNHIVNIINIIKDIFAYLIKINYKYRYPTNKTLLS